MNKYILLVGGVLVFVALLSGGVYFSLYKSKEAPMPPLESTSQPVANTTSAAIGVSPSPTQATSSGGTAPKVVTVKSLAQCPVDLSDDRNLVGISHNIFVGKVINEVNSAARYTQFAVSVIFNIKGNFQGIVSVGVDGGYRDGVFYVKEGETYLVPGSTYLLTTRQNSLLSCDSPIGFGRKLLSQDASLTTVQLQQLAENDSRVKQLQAAYPNEVVPQADIAHNNALNSYQSLTEAQKAALPYYVPPPKPYVPPAPTSTASSTGN